MLPGKHGKTNMRVLVTGSTGYIGSVLMNTLKQHGHDAIGLDADWFSDCQLYTASPHPSICVDLRHLDASHLVGVDAVCHLAGLCNDPLGSIDEQLTESINVTATTRLAELSKAAGVKRFIFSSSCSLYGAQDTDQLATEICPLCPQTAYARAKATAESNLTAIADD